MATADDRTRDVDRDDARPDYSRVDDDREPPPSDDHKPAWGYAFRRAFREFLDDDCPDLAAALTYYGVLSLFPAMVALISLPALIGQGQQTTDAIMGVVEDIAPATVADQVRGPLEELSAAPGAGIGLIVGLLVALWSASNYVNGFGRAMNRIYEVDEGRPFWKLRPIMIGITVLILLLVIAAAVILVVSGPVADAIGSAVGAGDTAVTVWNIAKWPVLALIVVFIIALLYWATPNVRQPKFRWLSPGALIAIVVWLIASAAFGFYVANFGNYNRVYGSLAGVIIFLLWLWISNLALLFGAEFDAEAERTRELRAGVVAEEDIQLPLRDTKKIEKTESKHADLVARGRDIRTGG